MKAVRRTVTVVAVMAALIGLPACSSTVEEPSLVLTLASPGDESESGSSDAIRRFVEEVDRRSSGTVRVEPVWQAVPPSTPQWDQATAKLVTDGKVDLALVPGRAFDLLGVETLRPLNAPFLVTSPAALRAVLESPIRDDLLAGLPDAGFAGLDLFPDAPRHPFGYGAPLLGHEDYVGEEIRTPASATVAELFESLHASVTDASLGADSQRGVESSFALNNADVATGNVTFFLKTNALVASTTLREGLRPDQWSLLRESAAATRGWLYDALPTDLESAVAYCETANGTIVAATKAQVTSLRDATATVTESMREDADLRPIVDAVAREVRGIPEPEPVTECPGGPAPGSLAALDGTYESVVTRRDLVNAGVTDPHDIAQDTGRFTWTLASGRWTFHQEVDHFATNLDDSGSYEYRDGIFTLDWGEPGDVSRMRVRIGANGDLHFSDIQEGLPENQALGEGFFGQPWRRVEEQPD